MTENVREMTFEEEYEILQKEKDELFATEKEDCEPPFANCVVRRALRCIRKLFAEIQQYRAIGTPDECKSAVERMKPRKPMGSNWKYCPNCKMQLLGGDGNCGICKQPIDWSE